MLRTMKTSSTSPMNMLLPLTLALLGACVANLVLLWPWL